MEGLILPILIAATVAMTVFGLVRVIAAATGGDKRKLADRLSTEVRYDPAAPNARSIRIQLEASGLPAMLANWSFFQSVHRKLSQAYPGTSLNRFLLLAVAVAVVTFLTGFTLIGSMTIAILIGLGGGYAPFMLLTFKRNKRQKLLTDQLPEAMDFLARVLKAGHSLSTGLQMIADELPLPLSAEFRQCYDQHSLGQPLEDSLRDMAIRIESTDVAFFVTAVLIQRQTGGDLSEVLRNISGMVRQRIRLHQAVKAKTAEGRLTGYIMVAFPLVMFFIAASMSEDYSQTLLHTTAGWKLIGTAASLQVMGLFAIKRITTITV